MRREQPRRRLRAHDLGRVTIEGDAHRVEPARVGELAHEAQHRVVPEVHAVVHADGDDRARLPAGPVSAFESSVEVVDDPHGSGPRDHDGGPQRRAARVRTPRAGCRRDRPARTARRRARPSAPSTRTTPRGDGPCLFVVDVDTLEIAHGDDERQHGRVGRGLDVVERARLVERERADAQPPQRREVRAPTERDAEVGGERAHVGAAAALDQERCASGYAPGSNASTSKRSTCTGRGARSTSSPSRASSCRRRPPTFTADTIGGSCSMSPTNAGSARSTSSLVIGIGRWSSTSPAASSVLVAMPNTTRPR